MSLGGKTGCGSTRPKFVGADIAAESLGGQAGICIGSGISDPDGPEIAADVLTRPGMASISEVGLGSSGGKKGTGQLDDAGRMSGPVEADRLRLGGITELSEAGSAVVAWDKDEGPTGSLAGTADSVRAPAD